MSKTTTKQRTSQYESKIKHLQVRSPVCRGEPPPGPTGWCLRPHLYDARCRRVAGHPISGGRRNVRTTARPPDQTRRGLLLLVVVVGDPDESTALWCLTALRRQRFRRGGVCCQRPFPRHSVFSGRGGTVLLLLTASVLLGILNANRQIRKRTDTDVAFTREYSRVSIFHRERECTN